ncbi:MAG: hypothetical protein C4554_01970 [Dethiobacter sp.]|jgi:hypothetical protein|nr:MAG: hypothetical protein C4554_01970 [Dethiobacter sp.]
MLIPEKSNGFFILWCFLMEGERLNLYFLVEIIKKYPLFGVETRGKNHPKSNIILPAHERWR